MSEIEPAFAEGIAFEAIPEEPNQIALPVLSKKILLLLAVGCGVTAANLYYAQPLLDPMARSLGGSIGTMGIVPMATQIGYACGLLFVVPLGDAMERSKLVAIMLALSILACIGTALSPTLPLVVFSSLILGLATCIPHSLIPLAVRLSPPEKRGRTVGTLMSGLLVGILLSRTFAGIVAQHSDWRTVYWLAAGAVTLLAVPLVLYLPKVPPHVRVTYPQLLKSTWKIACEERVLREAALNGAFMFGVFSVFWSTLDFLMESPAFHLGPEAAGLFGLVGAAGALSAGPVGRLADSRSPRFLVGVSSTIVLVSFLCMLVSGHSLVGLVIAVVLMDMGVQSANVSNQARVYALREEAQSRLIAVYISSYFVGGAIGSLLGTEAWALGGWIGVSAFGAFLSVLALTIHLSLKGKQIKA